jgi:hypothetical protein
MTSIVLGAVVAVMIVTLLAILTGVTPLPPFHKTQDAHEAAAKPLETQQPARSERDSSTTLCAICGTVESIRTMQVDAQPESAGREAGARADKRTVYRVTVHMDDGSYRTISQPVEPGYGVGEKVRVIDSSIKTGG